MEQNLDPERLLSLLRSATYQGISKHKAAPRRFSLPEYTGRPRSDATLCDRDAHFAPADMGTIPVLLRRGIAAGLVGHNWGPLAPTILWSVADSGWIFEGRITNPGTAEYHGYPVRPSEAIAEVVYRRFAEWVQTNGGVREKRAAANCKALYGL